MAVALIPTSMPSAVGAQGTSPRTALPTSALAIISTIDMAAGGLPASQSPQSIAINDVDDTIYVANYNENNVALIDGRSGQLVPHRLWLGPSRYPTGVAVDQGDDTVYVVTESSRALFAVNGPSPDDSTIRPLAIGPRAVAVNDADDTVYIAGTDDTGQPQLLVTSGRDLDDSALRPLANSPQQLAVDQSDDTVYVTGGILRVINGMSLDDSQAVTVGAAPWGLAVQAGDDTVYVAGNASNNLSIVNGRSNTVVATTSTGGMPYGVAIDQSQALVYVAAYLDKTLAEIDGRTAVATGQTVSFTGRPLSVAVDNAGQNLGLVYVTFPHIAGQPGENTVAVLGHVTPSIVSAGGAGSTASITLAVPHLASGYLMDDSTVTSVSFDGATVTHQPRDSLSNSWSFTVPPGHAGSTVPVTVTLNGGQVASAGTFTYPTPPPPAPIPASAPRNVSAAAGDAAATVTWAPPATSGSYPVTDYRVTSTPEGHACMTSALTCEVTGLANGTSYAFTVQALSGAGWSVPSESSNPVVPRSEVSPTLVITGSREGRHIAVAGMATGFGVGGVLRPWVRLAIRDRFREGAAAIVVGADGTFRWSRRTSQRAVVYVAVPDGSVRSNAVAISRR